MAPPKKELKLDRSIVEGPIPAAVWRIAWPTMVQNMIGGLQGVIDHALVGNFVGFTANAAIGVSWQIFLVVMVFVSSLFIGMGVLAARFAGAGDRAQVNRVVYQAFITAIGLALLVLAPVGYFSAPWLLALVHATDAVRHEATPFLRIMFTCSIGMMLFFMLGGALRAAGDAKTPLRLGIAMTVLNIVLNIVLIRGLGPIPALGTAGAAIGTCIASGSVGLFAVRQLWSGAWVISFKGLPSYRPDWEVIRQLFSFGLPAGVQGIAMNVAGVLLLRFIGSLALSAESQAAWSVAYTELFSFITWTSVGLMGASSTVAGQNLGAGHPDRAAQAALAASKLGIGVAAFFGTLYLVMPRTLLGVFGMTSGALIRHRRRVAALPRAVGLLHYRRAQLHGRAAGHGRHAEPARHLDHQPDHRAAGHLHRGADVLDARGAPHLDGGRVRALYPCGALGDAVPAGQVARDQGGAGQREGMIAPHGRRYRGNWLPSIPFTILSAFL